MLSDFRIGMACHLLLRNIPQHGIVQKRKQPFEQFRHLCGKLRARVGVGKLFKTVRSRRRAVSSVQDRVTSHMTPTPFSRHFPADLVGRLALGQHDQHLPEVVLGH